MTLQNSAPLWKHPDSCSPSAPWEDGTARKRKWAGGLCGACGRLPSPGTAGGEASPEEITAASPSLGPICRVIMFKSHTLSSIFVPLGCCYRNPMNWMVAKQRTFLFHKSGSWKSKMITLVNLVSGESPFLGSWMTIFLLCLHMVEEGARELSGVSFMRALIIFMRAAPS